MVSIVAAADTYRTARGVSRRSCSERGDSWGRRSCLWMEDGGWQGSSNQLSQRNSQKASTVVSHCSKLLGTSQKCLNIHFFAEELPHQTSQAGKIDWGVQCWSGTFYYSLTTHIIFAFVLKLQHICKSTCPSRAPSVVTQVNSNIQHASHQSKAHSLAASRSPDFGAIRGQIEFPR